MGGYLEYEHVSIVGADVVLQQQSFAITRGSCFQTWVIKLEPSGSVKPAHEGNNACAVLGLQFPYVGTVNYLARQLARKVVDLLVQIHHQEMQAVLAASAAMCELFNLFVAKSIRRQFVEPIEPILYARVRFRSCPSWSRGLVEPLFEARPPGT